MVKITVCVSSVEFLFAVGFRFLILPWITCPWAGFPREPPLEDEIRKKKKSCLRVLFYFITPFVFVPFHGPLWCAFFFFLILSLMAVFIFTLVFVRGSCPVRFLRVATIVNIVDAAARLFVLVCTFL
jgi:hypothetical protein